MDFVRDPTIVTLNENEVRVLETNLQATRDRFEVGDLTRTDVAQSEARLALARSTLATAQGRSRSSEENYRRVIGSLPGDLDPPDPPPSLPGPPPPGPTSRSRAPAVCRPFRRSAAAPIAISSAARRSSSEPRLGSACPR